MSRPVFEIDRPYWLHPKDRRGSIKGSRVMSGDSEIGRLFVRTPTMVDITLPKIDLIRIARRDFLFWESLGVGTDESQLLLDAMGALEARLVDDQFVMKYEFPPIHSGTVGSGKYSLYCNVFIVFKLKRVGMAPGGISDVDPNRLCVVGCLVNDDGWEIGRF